MLTLGDQPWTYFPSTDRTILISGYMLCKSVMGSDLSYENMMEDPMLQNLYSAKIVGEDKILDRPVWVLELKSKKVISLMTAENFGSIRNDLFL